MEQKYYTNERNVQIVIALLKAHGIHKVVASPGTTNITFVGSIQHDPWFEIYSSVDERSAAYLACGMAAKSGEPVVLSCTGATASRNYYSGLTEAFYRKLPIIALTSHQGTSCIGHLLAQNLDRRVQPNDLVKRSVEVPMVKDADDENFCTIEVNKALLELTHKGGGPVHINLFTAYSGDFSVKEIAPVRVIRRHTPFEKLPDIPTGRVVVFIGAHKPFAKEETKAIDAFCGTHDAVVFCDHTSGYKGRYGVNFSLPLVQNHYDSPFKQFDLLVHIGEVSGDYYSLKVKPKQVWRVNEDGELRDTFRALTEIFEMPERIFFEHYAKGECAKHTVIDGCRAENEQLHKEIPEIPFSNLWMAQQMSARLPGGCELHLGILNSLRSWNFFDIPKTVESFCNVGGFGIDGCVSSLIGASLADKQKLCFGVFGDLALFYDMNVLGNRHVGNNVRILLINNGRGQEFRNRSHLANRFGEDADAFMAAAGHFGNKSKLLMRHIAEDWGYEYLSCGNKEEFLSVLDHFLNPEFTSKPMLLEAFTESEDESMALETIMNFKYSAKELEKQKIKQTVKKVLGEKTVETVKKMLKQ